MTNSIIMCPVCEAEYSPSEIFIPNYFLGKPKVIIKTNDNKIKNIINGVEQDLEETYICDKCGSEFKVLASIDYRVELLFNNR